MPVATADHPGTDEPKPLVEAANRLMDRLPGYRVEIIDGMLSVAPLRDGPHADALTTVMLPLLSAGLSNGDTEVEVLQGIGLWLPSGPEYYAPGRQAPLPASIGAEVSLDVDEIVRAGSPKR
ncbi:hypothetical protein ACIRIR_10610 [Streptomyces globisporus]|uniref:hypothetical protein n=1 Tax=Streptomyces globisporus TaxID=1908 RepID=UPI00345F2889